MDADGTRGGTRPRRLVLPFLCCLILAAAPAAAQTSSAAERRAVDRAERLRQSGRGDEARSGLEEFLAESPAATEALALLYDVLGDLGDPGSALPFVEAALDASAEDPGAVRDLWVRALIAAGLSDSARVVSERWVSESPGDERAVLGLASARLARGDTSRAIARLGRAAAEGRSSLAIDLLRADLLVASGEIDAVADAWAALLGRETPAIDEVEADLARLEDPSGALGRLVRLAEGPGGPVAAVSFVAIRLGDAEAARRLAGAIGGEGREGFLRDYVREADLAGRPAEVAWAATELIVLSPRPVDKLRWRAMAADRSLAAGDSAGARESFAALASETRAGDGPHDAATRRLFDLLAADPDRLGEARDAFERYLREYPDSARVHGAMAGGLAEGTARGGDLAGAESVLRTERGRLAAGAHPALDAAAGRISFWAGARDSAVARTGRSLSEEGLGAAERTERLRRLTMLSAGDSVEVGHAGRVAFGLHREPASFDPAAALAELTRSPRGAGRATVLEYLGDLAARVGRAELARTLRQRIVDEHPASPEAPAAILALARSSGDAAAREWLERLIVGYPESALAPVARRLLSELDEGGNGG